MFHKEPICYLSRVIVKYILILVSIFGVQTDLPSFKLVDQQHLLVILFSREEEGTRFSSLGADWGRWQLLLFAFLRCLSVLFFFLTKHVSSPS